MADTLLRQLHIIFLDEKCFDWSLFLRAHFIISLYKFNQSCRAGDKLSYEVTMTQLNDAYICPQTTNHHDKLQISNIQSSKQSFISMTPKSKYFQSF